MIKEHAELASNNNIFTKPVIDQSLLLFIDMQERLLPAMPKSIEDTIEKQILLLKSATLLDLPVIITEQYPKGLGTTIAQIKDCFDSKWPIIEKSTFSCLGEPKVRMELVKSKTNTIILAGIESHVCVLQSAIDARLKGYQVIMVKDAINSRNIVDYETSFETAKSAGVIFMTAESLLFMLMVDSKHPAFRNISKLIK